MQSFQTFSVVAIAAALASSSASAVAVDLVLDPAGPGVNRANFTVEATVPPFGVLPVSDSIDASGTLVADVAFASDNVTPTSIELLAGTDVAFTDVNLVFGIVSVADTSNVSGTITSPVLSVLPNGDVDLGGSVLTLDMGFVNFIGDDPSNNDLSGNPIVLELDSGTVANLATSDNGDGTVSVVFSGPIAFSGQVDDDPLIELSVVGNLTARGTAVVPEPASLALLGLGSLTLLRRR
jgi:hypothetical protein